MPRAGLPDGSISRAGTWIGTVALIGAVVVLAACSPVRSVAVGVKDAVGAKDNVCEFAFDGDCDEPGRGTGLCPAGTDTADCSNPNPGANSCQFAFDGECDHPDVGTGVCPPDTDVADCRSVGAASGKNSCQWAFDGECDEPGIGTGACRRNTDSADCRAESGGVVVGQAPSTAAGIAPIPRHFPVVASGTGFYVNRQGNLVTNDHVVRGCAAVGVATDDDILPAVVVASDRRNDIAVVRTEIVPGTVALLRGSSDPSLGQKVYVVGYPLLTELGSINFTDGIVSSLTGYRGDAGSLQTSAAVQEGNSGGPLLDEGGVVIGIVNSGLVDAENIGFAIRVDSLITLLRQDGIAYNAAGTLSPVASESIASTAAGYTYPVLCFARR